MHSNRQDVASLLVGAWLVVSPFVLGMAGPAVWLTIALGLGVILFAIEAFVIPSYLEESCVSMVTKLRHAPSC